MLVLVVSAVFLSGWGGLVSSPKPHSLLGAGAGFCLLMLIVPGLFLMMAERATPVMFGLATGQGAVFGLCGSLYFFAGGGLSALLQYTAAGAGFGLFSAIGGWLRDRVIYGDRD